MMPRSLTAAALVLAAAPAWARDPIVLAPHRAIYDLSLVRSSESRGVDGARGRIAFEINGSACEGYAASFRQVVQMESSEAGSRVVDVRSTSFEDAQGKGYRFQIDRKLNQADAQTTEGRTRPNGEKLTVQLSKPKSEQVALPANVLFPSFHTKALIEAAEAGQNTLAAKTYDGSDEGQAIYETFAVIGPAISRKPEETLEDSAKLPVLQSAKSWPVTISYYKAGSGDQTPAYVMSMELYDNGVSRNLKLDYGTMVLKGELNRLDMGKPAPACN